MNANKFTEGSLFINNQGCTLIIVKYNNSTDVLIEFQDKHKHKMQAKRANILSGSVRNPYHPVFFGVGYSGFGEYKPTIDGEKTPEFVAWRNMMKRCYCQKFHDKYPTYIGCTVDERWHNFQNFAEWYVNQVGYDKGYHLDKDLLIQGNKVYSEWSCVLAPPEINTLLNENDLRRGIYPIGASLDKKSGLFSSKIKKYGKKVHLGHFIDASEAHKVYMVAKGQHIVDVANEWRGRIDEKLFGALTTRGLVMTSNNLEKTNEPVYDEELNELLSQVYNRMASESKPLDAEMAKILSDNIFDLF